jgi:integrase
MAKWVKTKFEGVRYREHATRKYGVRKDRYYSIRFRVDGKLVEEALGWETEWKASHPKGADSLEQEAIAKRAQLSKNKREGAGPRTMKEAKAQNVVVREAQTAKLQADAAAQKSLSEYWKESYFPAAKRSKKENSWQKEEQHFRLWIEPLLGALPLRSIGLRQWDELVKSLSKNSMSARSKEYITGTLRRVLKHAYDRRMIDDAPPTGKRVGVSGPGNNRRLRVISHEEEQVIMDHLSLSDPHAWKITRFAFLTGCRASEAFGLTWGNVDFSRGCITFAETKNHDSRIIPLTEPLLNLFSSMTSGGAGSYVFVKADGTPYKEAPSAFSTAVENLELNAGRGERDKIVFHSIRHSVATRLAQRLGPRDLMDIMGWRTVQMAMRYVHGNDDAKLKALSMLAWISTEDKSANMGGMKD